jgi:hypothetical protein
MGFLTKGLGISPVYVLTSIGGRLYLTDWLVERAVYGRERVRGQAAQKRQQDKLRIA